MIKTIIIDDERNARNTLISLLKRLPKKIEVIGEADDVLPGIELILKTQPDLIFLDIQLKNGTGFDVLTQITDIKGEVVFVTAYDSYAIRAFRMAAFGYLLKPIQLTELMDIINRFEDKIFRPDLSKHAKILIENFDKNSIKKLVVQNVSGFKVIPLEHILYIQGEINYSRLFLHNQEKLLTTKTLKEYESLLNEFGFFRIHQSYLINLRFVKEYIKGDGGVIIMDNDASLNLSRRRKQQFIRRFLGGAN